MSSTSTTAQEKRCRFVGRRRAAETAALASGRDQAIVTSCKSKGGKRVYSARPRTSHRIPDSILSNAELNNAITALPPNYKFEIHKTIHRLTQKVSSPLFLYFCFFNFSFWYSAAKSYRTPKKLLFSFQRGCWSILA